MSKKYETMGNTGSYESYEALVSDKRHLNVLEYGRIMFRGLPVERKNHLKKEILFKIQNEKNQHPYIDKFTAVVKYQDRTQFYSVKIYIVL